MLMGKELRLEKSSHSDFSFEFLSQNFQHANPLLSEPFAGLWLGLDSVMIMEWNWFVFLT